MLFWLLLFADLLSIYIINSIKSLIIDFNGRLFVGMPPDVEDIASYIFGRSPDLLSLFLGLISFGRFLVYWHFFLTYTKHWSWLFRILMLLKVLFVVLNFSFAIKLTIIECYSNFFSLNSQLLILIHFV